MQGLRLATGLLCVCLAMLAAGDSSLRVFFSGPASQALSDFRQGLTGSSNTISLVDEPAGADVLMPVGDRAFNEAVADVPVLGIQVSRHLLDRRRQGACRCSGIYAGARPADQLALLEQLLPGTQRIGVILSRHNEFLKPELEQALGDGRSMRVETVTAPDQLPAALAALLPSVDALLLLPDPELFNADTARLLLLTSYRQGKPVIGPDRAFVHAGSLASVDASADDLLESSRMLLRAVAGGELPAPDYAARSITVNPHVARAYGVLSFDEKLLEENLWGQP